MRRCIILVIALSAGGCSFKGALPAGDDMDVDSPDADPASPDASLDAPPGVIDTDADGVGDLVDNCPVTANSGQANEDGDATGDVCDPCPQLAAAQLDGDGDQVGDGCDPHPTTPGDELILFDGFTAAALDPAWSIETVGGSGSWQHAGGALAIDVGEPAGIVLRQVGAPGDTLVVEAAAEVSAVGPGPIRSFALLADAEPDPLAFDFCAISFDSSEVELYRYENATWASLETMPITTPLGAYHLRSRTMTGVMCTVNGMELGSMAGPGTGDHIGIRVRNATVRFAYVAVYRSP